jgi:hypothetical protein
VVDEDAEAGITRIKNELSKANIQVTRAHEEPYSLEDVFIGIVERSRNGNSAAEN